jgi:Mrp family chromosome partitioning ATPase
MAQHLFRRALRRHWWILVTVGLIVSVAGITFAAVRPQQFTSTTEVLVKPLAGSPFSSGSQKASNLGSVGLGTEANLVSSPKITARARKTLGTSAHLDKSHVSASVVPNSQILKITYKAQSPTVAKHGVSAFANAFLQSRKTKVSTLKTHKITDLQKKESSLKKQVGAAAKKASAASSTSTSIAQLQSATNHLADVQDDLSTAKSMPTNPGTVVAAASTPSIVRRGLPYAIAGLAVILGFALGLALMVLRARADDRIDPRYDLSAADVPIWAAMGDAARPMGGLITEADDTNAKEAYRRLRAALVANVRGPSIVAIASHEPMPAATDIAANLAVSLHEAGYKSAILDTELDHPRVAKLFGLPRSPGLAEVIAGTTSIEEATASHDGLSILTAGSNPDAILDRYSGEAFRSAAAAARSQTDYTIITADLSSAIGTTIAGVSDTAVLAVVENVTTHEEVAEIVDHVQTQQIRITGLATISSHAARRSADDPAPKPVQDGQERAAVAAVSRVEGANAGHASL